MINHHWDGHNWLSFFYISISLYLSIYVQTYIEHSQKELRRMCKQGYKTPTNIKPNFHKESFLISLLYVWKDKNRTKPKMCFAKFVEYARYEKNLLVNYFCKHSIFLNFKDCL
jgi:hypothetical protein